MRGGKGRKEEGRRALLAALFLIPPAQQRNLPRNFKPKKAATLKAQKSQVSLRAPAETPSCWRKTLSPSKKIKIKKIRPSLPQMVANRRSPDPSPRLEITEGRGSNKAKRSHHSNHFPGGSKPCPAPASQQAPGRGGLEGPGPGTGAG